MMLEAIWFKDEQEIMKVSPVWVIENVDDASDLSSIRVFDGYDWLRCYYPSDDFIVRVKK